MARPGSARRRQSLRAALIVAGAVTSFTACHHSAASEPGSPPLVSHAFGDTATYGIKILSLDRQREVAKVSLGAPSELIVLAVVPGREIELIVPSELPMQAPHGTYAKGVATVGMQRYDDQPRPVDASADAQARLAYNRCMQQVQAAAQRLAQSRRQVKRDSTGKVIEDSGRDPTADLDQVARMERQCDRYDTTTNRTAPPTRMPARAPADRYLVVLASSSRLSVDQVGERLTTLTAVGSDVATTIEAIAAGLYAGLPGKWSGTYVAW